MPDTQKKYEIKTRIKYDSAISEFFIYSMFKSFFGASFLEALCSCWWKVV